MTKHSINIFLLDDEFPVFKDFIEKGIYNEAISAENLYHLAITQDWKTLSYLQQLIKDIVTSKPCTDGLINLFGFTRPPQALSSIDDGLMPDVIIYDWEYGMPGIDSQNWLLEILASSTAFVFVYSKVRNDIPAFLNKKEFQPYANRFQLFLKGSTTHSIFTSEEFIFQYIIGKATSSGKIKIQGFDVEFTSNDYLSEASDLLHLERLLGKLYLLEEFKKLDFDLNQKTIEKILEDSDKYIFLSEEKKLLISPDETALLSKLTDVTKISYKDAAKQYSIQQLNETLEKGLVLINI